MKKAASYLIGEHDFKSFCCVKTQAESTVRTVYSLDVDKKDDEIHITITGNGFLYNMVRIIAGTNQNISNICLTPAIGHRRARRHHHRA